MYRYRGILGIGIGINIGKCIDAYRYVHNENKYIYIYRCIYVLLLLLLYIYIGCKLALTSAPEPGVRRRRTSGRCVGRFQDDFKIESVGGIIIESSTIVDGGSSYGSLLSLQPRGKNGAS